MRSSMPFYVRQVNIRKASNCSLLCLKFAGDFGPYKKCASAPLCDLIGVLYLRNCRDACTVAVKCRLFG